MIASLSRKLARTSERLSARPISVVVFAASIALLVTLQTTQIGRFRARAVAQARPVNHAAVAASFVSQVYVRAGDRVEPGTPLVELSPRFLDRELAQLDSEIAQLLLEAKLAQAQLLVDEERWLDEGLRRRPGRPSLRGQTEALYEARLELLRARREQIQEDRSSLVVASHATGLVASVVAPGSPVAVGTTVATVMPEHAEEVVAFVPPQTDPALIQPGAPARLLESQLAACRGPATVLRRGSGVAQAPGQLDRLFRVPLHGLPVYVSVPERCQLGVGQVLSVEFPKAGA
jgi:multidrug resistance efflux pump